MRARGGVHHHLKARWIGHDDVDCWPSTQDVDVALLRRITVDNAQLSKRTLEENVNRVAEWVSNEG
jgi:predicted pyridoxine 5'-phosphate oxidase superfamily flavin-nucleotide-binding protein